MSRLERHVWTPIGEGLVALVFAWDRFLDWANPDRVVCDFANKTDEGDGDE